MIDERSINQKDSEYQRGYKDGCSDTRKEVMNDMNKRIENITKSVDATLKDEPKEIDHKDGIRKG
jgi:hypothetical protein